ncbi:Zinc finger CCHC-type [Arabidopsis thaliana x Arabidopsis arenosa]|uniref:Zinc finger CCHC-type n=1 Tax=Arabidopsis thaliana x Arabidopsis arenosa TaxID=1240361 RepID=A0A8T1Z1S8_9BRAS|nr:Zinc finger CCHC-type [Arabidopsis thaliana x Arabidopsis arenosa]
MWREPGTIPVTSDIRSIVLHMSEIDQSSLQGFQEGHMPMIGVSNLERFSQDETSTALAMDLMDLSAPPLPSLHASVGYQIGNFSSSGLMNVDVDEMGDLHDVPIMSSSQEQMSSKRSSGASNSVDPLFSHDEPNLENFFPPSSAEDGSCSVAFNNQINEEACESTDTDTTDMDTSIESDPSECSEEAEGVIINQDSQSVEIQCDEECHVQWMIDEEGQMYAVPLGEYNEDQVEDSLNNMLSQFYVETSNGDEDLGIPEMETIGEYGLGLSASMTVLFEVPITEVDGALEAKNQYEAEMGINEEMGDDEAAENEAIMLELELEHAIDQLIAECAQDSPAEPEPIGEGSDSSSDSFESLTPEPADPNPSLSPLVVQQEPQEEMVCSSEVELCPELEVLKGNELSIEERQGRWDPMMLEQELNHDSLMNRLKIDEGKLKDQVADNMEVDGKSKGKRVAELEGEQGRIKDRRIIVAEPHPLGIGYGVMSKVKPRIRATARKSVGGRRTSLVKTSPPCGVCSRTDHHSDACPVAQPVQPYMVEYVKCYYCGGVGHVSMYCPYTASNVGEGSSRGAGPSATVATEEKCLNEGMSSFLWVKCECPECKET